jgi:phage head maturation protease
MLLLRCQGQLAIAFGVLKIEQSSNETSAILVTNQNVFQLIELLVVAVPRLDAS